MKIAISYRAESWGKAAFFDHFTVRAMTKLETVICKPNDTPEVDIANYINSRGGDKKKCPLPINSDIPETVTDWAESSGFIFIPGYTRDSDNLQPESHKQRLQFEQQLINKAQLRGQPVLAVCAGSWTLWETYGGTTKEVSDHNYGGAMPRLSASQPKVCNNKMIHKATPVPNTFLSGIAGGVSPFAVNSVHWKAPDDLAEKPIELLEVSARSQKDDALAPNSRQGQKMQPDDCVEAFETKCGAPMIGIQWHPEAFNPKEANAKNHKSLFSFMVGAGQTYLQRRKLNEEFKKNIGQSKIRFFTDKPGNIDPNLPSKTSDMAPGA
ncbi:MAG: gamma-glutamyl-gamma-aminobutyrate hydrolase family protein [Tatlockia sp.]